MERSENLDNEKVDPYSALLVAFKTMEERCQKLQTRLDTVEEENICLRLECLQHEPIDITKSNDDNEKTIIPMLKERIEELKKQKSQLTHQVFMVAAENRQLWKRLGKLTKTNKSLGSHLTKISDTLKQHSPAQPSEIVSYSFGDITSSTKGDNNQQNALNTNQGETEQSLEEISLKLINSIKLEKSDLEQQYAEMVELQNNTKLNLPNMGFMYLEDSETDIELFKQHDVKLSQMKNALLEQQTKLRRILQNFKKKKKGLICNSCLMNASKKMCQVGIQINFDEDKEDGVTQTSLQTPNLSLEKCSNSDITDHENKICPLCATLYGKATTFSEFHEHVLNHFTKDMSMDGFEIIH